MNFASGQFRTTFVGTNFLRDRQQLANCKNWFPQELIPLKYYIYHSFPQNCRFQGEKYFVWHQSLAASMEWFVVGENWMIGTLKPFQSQTLWVDTRM